MRHSDCLATAAVYCYSFFCDVIRTMVFPLLRGIGTRKNWDLDKRQALPSPIRDFRGKKVAWIHAASLGEAKLLLKFLAMLRERHHDELYVVTATTRSGVTFLEQNRHPSFCAIGFQPIDSLLLVRHIIEHYSIKRLWILETELWPSLFMVCKQKSVPIGIVNGRIEPRSFSWYRHLQWLVRPLLGQVDIVFAQSNEYAERFMALGVQHEAVHIVGNIKGHIRIGRPDKNDWLTLRRKLNICEDGFVITAGCIHAGEGAALSALMAEMERLRYPCKLIIVPRHLEETTALLEEIDGRVVHLRECATSTVWNVCIIEQIGILDDMYKIADAAVVGGTFIPVGGHNVWDAACFAIPVFFGPYYDKQKESCTLLLEAGVGFQVADGTSLGACIYDVVKADPMAFLHAQHTFVARANAAGSVVEPLLP